MYRQAYLRRHGSQRASVQVTNVLKVGLNALPVQYQLSLCSRQYNATDETESTKDKCSYLKGDRAINEESECDQP
jgi:hypothetical protein